MDGWIAVLAGAAFAGGALAAAVLAARLTWRGVSALRAGAPPPDRFDSGV